MQTLEVCTRLTVSHLLTSNSSLMLIQVALEGIIIRLVLFVCSLTILVFAFFLMKLMTKWKPPKVTGQGLLSGTGMTLQWHFGMGGMGQWTQCLTLDADKTGRLCWGTAELGPRGWALRWDFLSVSQATCSEPPPPVWSVGTGDAGKAVELGPLSSNGGTARGKHLPQDQHTRAVMINTFSFLT